ncbi:hypothetical protein Rcae01_00132 [Novipirellula caenicola]|uniref:Uncharacterized protein n=1 Tax=Novipirellula caenicola TaxID=1536901 RepID=A0ABP9VKL6_9BACT
MQKGQQNKNNFIDGQQADYGFLSRIDKAWTADKISIDAENRHGCVELHLF